jgi:hypothetical protein
VCETAVRRDRGVFFKPKKTHNAMLAAPNLYIISPQGETESGKGRKEGNLPSKPGGPMIDSILGKHVRGENDIADEVDADQHNEADGRSAEPLPSGTIFQLAVIPSVDWKSRHSPCHIPKGLEESSRAQASWPMR